MLLCFPEIILIIGGYMKIAYKYFLAAIIIFCFFLSSQSFGVQPRKAKPHDISDTIPAKIDDVSYVTGVEDIDVSKYSQQQQYRGWFDLNEDEAIFRRNMIDQKKGKGITAVDIIKFKYKDIKELYFGYDAIYKAANDSLPTALTKIYNRGASYFVGAPMYMPLHQFLKQKNRSPIIIYIQQENKLISLVLLAPNNKAKALYLLLAKQSGLKVKEPIVGQDAEKAGSK